METQFASTKKGINQIFAFHYFLVILEQILIISKLSIDNNNKQYRVPPLFFPFPTCEIFEKIKVASNTELVVISGFLLYDAMVLTCWALESLLVLLIVKTGCLPGHLGSFSGGDALKIKNITWAPIA